MNPSTANFTLVVGVVAIGLSVVFYPPVAAHHWFVRSLWAMAVVSVLGLAGYYTLWTGAQPVKAVEPPGSHVPSIAVTGFKVERLEIGKPIVIGVNYTNSAPSLKLRVFGGVYVVGYGGNISRRQVETKLWSDHLLDIAKLGTVDDPFIAPSGQMVLKVSGGVLHIENERQMLARGDARIYVLGTISFDGGNVEFCGSLNPFQGSDALLCFEHNGPPTNEIAAARANIPDRVEGPREQQDVAGIAKRVHGTIRWIEVGEGGTLRGSEDEITVTVWLSLRNDDRPTKLSNWRLSVRFLDDPQPRPLRVRRFDPRRAIYLFRDRGKTRPILELKGGSAIQDQIRDGLPATNIPVEGFLLATSSNIKRTDLVEDDGKFRDGVTFTVNYEDEFQRRYVLEQELKRRN